MWQRTAWWGFVLLGRWLNAVSADKCPDRVFPAPHRTLGILRPLTYYKCGNVSLDSSQALAYSTFISNEVPTSREDWVRDCTEGISWSSADAAAGEFTTDCCPSGEIARWRVWQTTGRNWLGRVSAVCNDANGTELNPVTYGVNNTNTSCGISLTDAVERPVTEVHSVRAGADIYQLFGVGRPARQSYNITCPPGLVPIGFGARSSCHSLKDFKILCAAPAPTTKRFSILTTASESRRDRKACLVNVDVCPASEPIGRPGRWAPGYSPHLPYSRTNPYTSGDSGPVQSDCCDSGHIVTWYITNSTDDRSSLPKLGQISALCSDGNILSPIIFGFNGSNNADCRLVRPELTGGLILPTPVDATFIYSTDYVTGIRRLMVSFLTKSFHGYSSSFSCPNGTKAIGYSAASACLGLNQFQVYCGVPRSQLPVTLTPSPLSAPSPPPSLGCTFGQTQTVVQSQSSPLEGGALAGLVFGIAIGGMLILSIVVHLCRRMQAYLAGL